MNICVLFDDYETLLQDNYVRLLKYTRSICIKISDPVTQVYASIFVFYTIAIRIILSLKEFITRLKKIYVDMKNYLQISIIKFVFLKKISSLKFID
jgi:hypothetical protein